MEKLLFTSESVTEGHPDKICDQISDAVLDELLKQDPLSRVACETAVTTGLVLVMGEISSKAHINIQKIVRKTILDIGYDDTDKGFASTDALRNHHGTIIIVRLWRHQDVAIKRAAGSNPTSRHIGLCATNRVVNSYDAF